MLHLLGCHEFTSDFEGVAVLAKGAGMAAVPAALVVLGWIRKARHEKLVQSRIARGECVGCGYPLGVHDKCTECGRVVERRDV